MADNTQPQLSWWANFPWSPLVWLVIQTIGMVALIVQMRSDILSLKMEIQDHNRTLERLDERGTSGLRLLEARVIKNEERLSNLAQEDIARQKGISDSALQTIRDSLKLQAQLDLLGANQKRIEEQQTRILQALDNTYSTLQEHLRGAGGSQQKNQRLNLNEQR